MTIDLDVGRGWLGGVRDLEVEVGHAVVEGDAREALSVGITGVADLAVAVEGAGHGGGRAAPAQHLAAYRSGRMVGVVDVEVESRRVVEDRGDGAGVGRHRSEGHPRAAAGVGKRGLEVDRDATVLAGRSGVDVARGGLGDIGHR